MPLLAVITAVLSIYFKNAPFIHNYHNIFPSSTNIERSADTIINEFNTYLINNKIDCIRKTNPGFKIENTISNTNCWRALYLKKTGAVDQEMIKQFPNTIKLIEDEEIHNAFFSILDPGVEIPPHVGYYKGYLRYHMGIIIPNNSSNDNTNKAYIVCGDEKYIWKEKEGIVFDDMYLHYVKNPTNQTRVVLYLDVKRKSENPIINFINNIGIYLMENSILLKTFLKNQHNQNKISEFSN
jgi:beta-hydroxylase